MASQIFSLSPNSTAIESDGADWELVTTIGGDTKHAAIASTSSTRYLRSDTTGDDNTFGFSGGSDIPDDAVIQWIWLYIVWGSSVANEPMALRLQLVNGSDSSTFYTEVLELVGPSNTGKVLTTQSQGNYALKTTSDGSTAWTKTEMENLLIRLEVYDNSTTDNDTSNYLEIMQVRVDVMCRTTFPGQFVRADATYNAGSDMNITKNTAKITKNTAEINLK